MIAPKKVKEYPKFLKCNDIVKDWTWNKYLPIPWVIGELVKVAPESEQHSSKYVGSNDSTFRKYTWLFIVRIKMENSPSNRRQNGDSLI